MKPYKIKYWICDCSPPLPDLMPYWEKKCKVCKKVKPLETNKKIK